MNNGERLLAYEHLRLYCLVIMENVCCSKYIFVYSLVNNGERSLFHEHLRLKFSTTVCCSVSQTVAWNGESHSFDIPGEIENQTKH